MARGVVRGPLIGAGRAVLRALLVLGLLVWVALPVAGYLKLNESTRAASLAPAVDVWAPVQASTVPTRRTIGVVVGRAPVVELYAPAWSGLVEATDVGSGTVLHEGDVLATVGGIDRIAVTSERPFGRELHRDDEGSDVASLNALLSRRGLVAPDSDEFTARTLASVRSLAKELGVPQSGTVESFDPAWVVFLPLPDVRVAASALHVGAPAPAAGEVIVTSRPRLSSALLDAVGTSEAGEGDEGTVQTAVTAGEGERLEVGGRELPLAPDRLGVEVSGWDALDGMIDPARSRIDAVLVAEPVPGTWIVPGAAVGIDETGASCLVRRGGAGPSERIAVTVASSTLGRSTVSGPLADGDEVLVSTATGGAPCS
ncbi:hypothetical protein [Rathayibacter sp. Leaf248]|uniref:hypothetical protein n=1 Tax=Rathayibacter sp. Leaf248 TaxID=2876555 RepID=UPI001E3D22CC|nr:hypothetical protein [Rathayibacter sp. Leaf248]